MNKLIKLSATLLVSLSTIGILGSCEPKEFNITSLKQGLKYLNTKKNYTISYQTASGDHCSLFFEKKSIGLKIENKNGSQQLHYIQDKKGIYPLQYNETYIPGEYILNENQERYTSLWDNSFYQTLLGVESDYINNLDDKVNDLAVTNKKYKVAIIKTLGFTDTDYPNVDYIKCSYKDQSLSFEIKMLNKNPIAYKVSSLNSTINQDVKTYLKQGGKVFTPSNELSTMRSLIRSNNFTRDIYDINEKRYIGCEIFHPNYFYSEIYGSGFGSGAMELNQKANNDHNFDLYGCYYFDTKGSVQGKVNSVSFYPYAAYEKPDVVEMYHYPTYLQILDNLQYFKEGHLDSTKYTPTGKTYIIEDLYYIYDFIYNFSFESSYDPQTCIPYGLEVDIALNEDASLNKITFVYSFHYQNKLYSVLVPLYNFNNSSIELLDEMYSRLNA